MPTLPPLLALGLEYPIALRGGVSVLVEELARGLAGHFRLVLISPDEPAAVRDSALGKVWTEQVRWKPEAPSGRTARARAARLAELGVALAHFHCGGNYGWGMRWLGRCPIPFVARAGMRCVTTVHSVATILEGYCDVKKPAWFKAALLPAAWLGKMHALAHTAVEIAVSHHDEAHLRRWYAPLASRFRQIYHSRLRLLPEPGPAPARSSVILNVGHLALRKGQDVLAEAFARVAARHPAWQLQLAGHDGDRECAARVRAVAARFGVEDRVHLLGSRDDALELMRTAGIYVQPSLAEALGLALQEALFAGCPAIGSTAGGIPELIADGDNGLLVPRGDVAALAQALDRMMSDASLRARLGGRARPSIIERGMLADAMIQHHLALYRGLLAAGPRP